MATARWVALPLALAVFLLCADLATARADRGVSVDLGKIEVSQKLSRGGTYHLPTMGVRNPGSEASRYVMGVSHLQDQPQRQAPSSWFTFSPAEFRLEPGKTQPVTMTLTIPTGARPDDYGALLSAQLAPEGEGAEVGAAAGARLEFTVKPSNLLQAWQLKAQTFFSDNAPWSYLLPAAVVLVAAGLWLGRRFSFRLERRS